MDYECIRFCFRRCLGVLSGSGAFCFFAKEERREEATGELEGRCFVSYQKLIDIIYMMRSKQPGASL